MLKYAILSDIHSNSYALKAVLEHAQSQGVERYINLGDILYGPIAPRATYDLLQTIDATTICGNQDRQIFQATPEEIDANPTMQFILQDLGPEPIQWMKTLPFDSQITQDIYACHGSPQDDMVYLLEDVSSGSPSLRVDSEIKKLLGGNTSPIILCGHTHIARCVELSSGQLVVNPGSVGMPAYTDEEPHLHSMETYSAKASYAILSQQSNGAWNVALHKISYPVKTSARLAEQRQRLDWVHFLTTGRGLQY